MIPFVDLSIYFGSAPSEDVVIAYICKGHAAARDLRLRLLAHTICFGITIENLA